MTATAPHDDTLDGVHVVTLAPNLPGPLAVARLVAFGARATKIEPPGGDQLELVAPQWYAELCRGQEVVRLDLKTADGRARLEDLLADADVLMTSMRPSAAERLELPDLLERHGVAHVEIVGHAGDGAERSGHDLTYQAEQGTIRPPHTPLIPVADMLGAERAVSATFATLRRRDAGHPAHVRVTLEAAARDAAAGVRHGLTTPSGPLGGALPQYAVYPTSDGHVAVAALEPHFTARLGELVGTTAEELTAAFASRTSADWVAAAQAADVPLVAVREPAPADTASATDA